MNVSWSGATVGERVLRRREPESAQGFAAAFVDAVDEWMLELQQVAELSCEFVKGAGAVYAGDVAVRVAQIPLLVFWPAHRPEERRYCVVEFVQADPLSVNRPGFLGGSDVPPNWWTWFIGIGHAPESKESSEYHVHTHPNFDVKSSI